jgi:hypothetical protein
MHAMTEAVPPLAASDLWLVRPLHGKLGEAGGFGRARLRKAPCHCQRRDGLDRLARKPPRSRNEPWGRYRDRLLDDTCRESHRPGISPSFRPRSPPVNRVLSLLRGARALPYTRRPELVRRHFPRTGGGCRRSMESPIPVLHSVWICMWTFAGDGVPGRRRNGGRCSAG